MIFLKSQSQGHPTFLFHPMMNSHLVITLTEYSTPGSNSIASSRRRLDSNWVMLSKPLPLRIMIMMMTMMIVMMMMMMRDDGGDYDDADANLLLMLSFGQSRTS